MNHKKYLKLAILSFVIFSCTTFISSCTDSKKQEEGLEDEEEFDPGKDILTNLYGELFSIPSPLQTSILLKSSGANYSKDLLNVTSKLPSYSTEYKKALNLGVYGADLGYVIIYGQTQDALGYLSASKKDFKNKQVVIQRVGEQKNTLDHVIKLLTPYYQNPDLTELTELTDALLDLFHDFEDIEMKYTYVKPTTDVANKITTINSTTEVKITDEQLNNISEKLAGIRSMIIN